MKNIVWKQYMDNRASWHMPSVGLIVGNQTFYPVHSNIMYIHSACIINVGILMSTSQSTQTISPQFLHYECCIRGMVLLQYMLHETQHIWNKCWVIHMSFSECLHCECYSNTIVHAQWMMDCTQGYTTLPVSGMLSYIYGAHKNKFTMRCGINMPASYSASTRSAAL